VLERVQAEVGEVRSFRVTDDSEDPAHAAPYPSFVEASETRRAARSFRLSGEQAGALRRFGKPHTVSDPRRK
jgi:hypothetical protein